MRNLSVALFAALSLAASSSYAGQEFLVESDEASRLALSHMQTRAPFRRHAIHDTTSFPDRSGSVAMHVVQFEGGGFVVLSADRRVSPVLAYSATNTFPVGSNVVGPVGVNVWLAEHMRRIEGVRAGNTRPRERVVELWDALALQSTHGSSSNAISSMDCGPVLISTVGPLMTTLWSQGCGYNLDTPSGCSSNCGHAQTGCVATAGAQVMRYFRYPTQYSWSSMPSTITGCSGTCSSSSDFVAGTAEVARLIGAVGGAVSMSYGCDASGAEFSKLQSALVNRFSYKAQYGGYDLNTVKNEHLAGRPVLHDGFTDQSCFLFWCWANGEGHAWVSDGYEHFTTCSGSLDFLHMNWGWNGAYNGYYQNFNVDGYNFQYYNSIIYSIYPNPPPLTCADPGGPTCSGGRVCCDCNVPASCMTASACKKACNL